MQAPIRHGTTGGLIAPDSGTISIIKPDGSALVSGAAVTVSSSIAQYDVTPSASETLGEGWEVRWSLVFSGVTYPVFRTSGILAEYVPANNVSAVDLYGLWPGLAERIPQSQGDTADGGDGTGWQRQIDDAYYAFLRTILADARPAWLIVEGSGYYDWLLAAAYQRCVRAIDNLAGDEVEQRRRDAFFGMQKAEAHIRLRFSDEPIGTRIGGTAVTRLAPDRSGWWAG